MPVTGCHAALDGENNTKKEGLCEEALKRGGVN